MKRLVILILFILGSVQSWSQMAEATATLNNDSISIGQHLTYELKLITPDGFDVEWPIWNDTIPGGIEVLSRGKVEKLPVTQKGNTIYRQNVVITAFEAGRKMVPPVKLRFKNQSDTTHYTAQTSPVMFVVTSVAVDTAQAFKPIIGPVKEPITFMEILPWILGGLGILLLIAAVIWYMKRRQKILPVIQAFTKPQVLPHIAALEKLEELRYAKLWQSGQIKEYYTQLTDIVRVYIEEQFRVSAVEMTTDEIIDGIRPLKINQEAGMKLQQVLQLADYVKFAKANPSSMDNEVSLNHLVDFVKESYALVQIPAIPAFPPVESKEIGEEGA
ncbi:MAG: hypothetical protein ACOYN5_01195 [Bacteroidales bacterium]